MKVLLSTIALSTMLISCGGEKNKSGSNDVISSSSAQELKSIISAELWGTSWEGPYIKERPEINNNPHDKIILNFLSLEILLKMKINQKEKLVK